MGLVKIDGNIYDRKKLDDETRKLLSRVDELLVKQKTISETITKKRASHRKMVALLEARLIKKIAGF